jgi:transcriptional regulator with XRE-family HTH domain
MARRIRSTMDERGITLAELAKRVGVTWPTVWRWTTGAKRQSGTGGAIEPNDQHVRALARVLGVTELWLRKGDGK